MYIESVWIKSKLHANVFIDWNCFSGEQCGPCASCLYNLWKHFLNGFSVMSDPRTIPLPAAVGPKATVWLELTCKMHLASYVLLYLKIFLSWNFTFTRNADFIILWMTIIGKLRPNYDVKIVFAVRHLTDRSTSFIYHMVTIRKCRH